MYLNLLNFDDFSKELIRQCNLKNEHENLLKFKTNLSFLKFPNIIYSSTNILIEEFIDGNKIYYYKDNNDLYMELNIKILVIFLEMINNLYIHSDFHYGNILINKNHDIYILIMDLQKIYKKLKK